jgi:RNA polymerase sigma-70 factor (ECF subfamily)
MFNTESSAQSNSDYVTPRTSFANFDAPHPKSTKVAVWMPASSLTTNAAPIPTQANCVTHSAPDRDMMSEGTLVLAAQAGQEWAFTELFLRNRQRVLRSIVRITRNPEDAEDALQEAMMRAFVNLARFDRRSNFSTWFTRIAINSSLMLLRKRSRVAALSIDETPDIQEAGRRIEFADRTPNPEQCYAYCEIEARVLKAISRLPNTLRSVIEIRRLDQGSMEEIATTLSISTPAAKSRILRARATLRSSLNKRRILQNEAMPADRIRPPHSDCVRKPSPTSLR